MLRTDSSPTSAAQIVSTRVAEADRLRRARAAERRFWRLAPAAAVAALASAAVSFVFSWPSPVPLLVTAAIAGALLVDFAVHRRSRPVPDGAAAAIDAAAGLRGELRSAFWFSQQPRRDEWVEWHLQQSAERLAQVDWRGLYPPSRPRRAQLLSAALATTTIWLAVTIPDEPWILPSAYGGPIPIAGTGPLDGSPITLTPELLERLQKLLAATERGDADAAAVLGQDEELRQRLDKLARLNDQQLLETLARQLAADPSKTSGSEAMKSLADRAREAAESGSLSAAMQNALEQLANELEIAAPELARAENGSSPVAGTQSGEGGGATEGGAQDGAMQLTRDGGAGEAAGVVMLSTDEAGAGGGMPGGGMGGAGSDDLAGSKAAIEAALRQEMVQANRDAPGEMVDSEIRRRTEHGEASVAFSGGPSGTFDRARAVSPPPVPEARRTGVQNYFVRRAP